MRSATNTLRCGVEHAENRADIWVAQPLFGRSIPATQYLHTTRYAPLEAKSHSVWAIRHRKAALSGGLCFDDIDYCTMLLNTPGFMRIHSLLLPLDTSSRLTITDPTRHNSARAPS
jgi:hypothetical protein